MYTVVCYSDDGFERKDLTKNFCSNAEADAYAKAILKDNCEVNVMYDASGDYKCELRPILAVYKKESK